MQVDAVTGELLVLQLAHLDVEVAGCAAAGADLALAGQADPDAVADARRDVRTDGPAGTHPAVAVALAARLRDDLAVSTRHTGQGRDVMT